jgi:hypothetical protein
MIQAHPPSRCIAQTAIVDVPDSIRFEHCASTFDIGLPPLQSDNGQLI